MSRAVAAGSVVSGWEFLSKYYTARIVRVSGAGGLAFSDSFLSILFFLFFFFSSHFMSPLLANLTPRRARTEHRRALIWSDFKTGAGAKQDGGPLGGGVFMRAGVVLVLRHFSLSPSLSLSLPISSQIWPVLSPAEKMTMIDEVVILVFCSS